MKSNRSVKQKIIALFLLIATAALCFSGCSVAERIPEKLIEKLMEAYVPTDRDVFDERSDIIERRHQLMENYYIDDAEDETKFPEENISKATAELIEDFLVYNRYRGYFSKVKGINSTNYANIKYLQHHALNELEKRADAPTALVQTLCSLSDEYFEYKEGKLSLSGEYGNEVYDYTMVTLSYIIGSEFYRDKLSADEATVYEYICKKAGIEPYKTYSFIDDDKAKKYDYDALAAKITEAYTPTGRDIFRERCDMAELRRKMAEENGGDYFAAAAETRFPEDKLDADTQNLIIDFLICNRYEGVLDNDSGLSDKIYINCIGKHQRYVLEELETREDALDLLLHTFVDLSDEYFKYLSGEYSLSEKYDEEVFKYTMDTLTYIIGSEFYKVNLTDEEAALYEYICEKANLIPYKVYPCSYFDEMVLPDR